MLSHLQPEEDVAIRAELEDPDPVSHGSGTCRMAMIKTLMK